jgi:inorganic pyrophosphatase
MYGFCTEALAKALQKEKKKVSICGLIPSDEAVKIIESAINEYRNTRSHHD